jgi:uncharacterized damage-inducible protein DinB
MAERFRRWFEYEKDAHAKVMRSLETVPADRRAGPEFRKAVTLLAHLAAARQLWLYRLGKYPDPPAAIFPEADLAGVAQRLRAVEASWDEYLGGVADEELARTFEYQSLDAGRFRNRIEDILAQLFTHSPYHRGQIAMLVRAAGGEPAATDLVYWCREPVPAG